MLSVGELYKVIDSSTLGARIHVLYIPLCAYCTVVCAAGVLVVFVLYLGQLCS